MKPKTKIEVLQNLLKESKKNVDIARRKNDPNIHEYMQEVIMYAEILRLNKK